jgi:hypothetical protein
MARDVERRCPHFARLKRSGARDDLPLAPHDDAADDSHRCLVAGGHDRWKHRNFLDSERAAPAPLPVEKPSELVHVTDSVLRETGQTRIRVWSNPFWEQIRQRRDLFAGTAAWSFTRFDTSSGGETQLVEGMWVDGGFFATLGIPAFRGRTFSTVDDRRGGGPDGAVAMISYGYWQRQFGGADDVVGRVLRLDSVPFTVVGITPPDFFGMEVGRTFDVARTARYRTARSWP